MDETRETTWHCQQEAQEIPSHAVVPSGPLWEVKCVFSLPLHPSAPQHFHTLAFLQIRKEKGHCPSLPSSTFSWDNVSASTHLAVLCPLCLQVSPAPRIVCLTNRSMPASCMLCWALPLRKWSTHFKGLFSTPQNLGVLLKPKLPPQIISQCIRWVGMPRIQWLALNPSSPFVREPNTTHEHPLGPNHLARALLILLWW